jgi:hypothetical protein
VTILELSIAFSREDNTFTIRYIGTLFNVGDAEITVTGTRVESLEIGVVGVKSPNGGLVVVESV